MKGGWAIWLVSALASIAAHAGLATALSGLTLQAAPPALADLYIGDAANEAPLEVEAIVEQAVQPLEAENAGVEQIAAATAGVEQIAAETAGQVAVPDTPSPTSADALTPPEVQAAAPGTIEPRVSPVEESEVEPERLSPAADVPAQSSSPAEPVELPEADDADAATEARTSPVAEKEGSSPPLDAAEDAASPALADAELAEPAPPELNAAEVEARGSASAEASTAAPLVPAAVEPAGIDSVARAEPVAAVPETAIAQDPTEAGGRTVSEAGAPAGIDSVARAEPVAAVPETAIAQDPTDAGGRTVSEAGAPPHSVESAEASTAQVAGTGAAATIVAAPPERGTAEPVASAASQPQVSAAPAIEEERQVAALPPAAELPVPRKERIVRFMRGYKGGRCFFAKLAALDEEQPRLDGFVLETDAIQKFGNAFYREVGVDPGIAMRRVMEAQCPAVDFIKKVLRNRVRLIAIRLNADVVRGRELLVGRLAGGRSPYTLLFIVDDDGIVHNLSDDLRPDANGQTFAAEIHPTAEGRSRNQLILAVGSAMPLDMPGGRRMGDAAPFLERLQSQSAEAGGMLALGYATFRVE